MKPIASDIVIIGAGLTGLSLCHFLKDSPLKITLVEARPRIGGRIHTLRPPSGPPVEMGATWLGTKHTRLVHLLQSLGLEVFPQKLGTHAIYEWISTSPHQLVALPPNQEPSYRIRGGTASLIDALAKGLPEESLYLGEPVEKISTSTEGMAVHTAKRVFEAARVVSTLPPNLLLNKVVIEPELPGDLIRIMGNTHTWMGESIKIGLRSREAFWRNPESSGTVFSNVGPVTELYDHSSFEEDGHALKGFLNGTYASMSKADRKAMVLNQLGKYYGPGIANHLEYHEAVWAKEPYTYCPYASHVMPHQNNGHDVYRRPLLDGKLFIAGSETAEAFPGYMEGAVESALWIKAYLLDQFKKTRPAAGFDDSK
ncbi:MAG: NAD(P)/FAD-dependent oxidoreductase [Robiginitalea sp.]|nr:NAD(P)/FAD-dependent oxidoreductase [Robiginitalea sp.]